MHEPPLSDRELQIVRGMIDSYETERIVEQWFARSWRNAAKLVAILSACAITAASILELSRSLFGG